MLKNTFNEYEKQLPLILLLLTHARIELMFIFVILSFLTFDNENFKAKNPILKTKIHQKWTEACFAFSTYGDKAPLRICLNFSKLRKSTFSIFQFRFSDKMISSFELLVSGSAGNEHWK